LNALGGLIVEDNSSLSCGEIEPLARAAENGEVLIVSGNQEPCDFGTQ
jgi:hypothetical protein